MFWGAFEQAGGLMSIYTEQKTDRVLSFALPFIGNEVPAAVFQSVNAFFIITLGTLVGAFWYRWGKKGKESSSLFKMAIGVIVMGFGFFFMRAFLTYFFKQYCLKCFQNIVEIMLQYFTVLICTRGTTYHGHTYGGRSQTTWTR